MRLRLVVLLLPFVAILGCGDDDDATTAADDTSTTVAESVELHVEPDGLAIDGEPLRFGASRDEVTTALGAPTEEGEQPECPGGPSSFVRYEERGLLLVLQDDELVGW